MGDLSAQGAGCLHEGTYVEYSCGLGPRQSRSNERGLGQPRELGSVVCATVLPPAGLVDVCHRLNCSVIGSSTRLQNCLRERVCGNSKGKERESEVNMKRGRRGRNMERAE